MSTLLDQYQVKCRGERFKVNRCHRLPEFREIISTPMDTVVDHDMIQKRSFTKWVNSVLKKVSLEVEDLYKDFSDGTKLIALLECLSNEKLPKPNPNAKLRIHKLENVSKALSFLHANQVKLENISADNIVDGNPTLVLGLVWTMILRFQVAEIQLEGLFFNIARLSYSLSLSVSFSRFSDHALQPSSLFLSRFFC
jgi:hypothetical protein